MKFTKTFLCVQLVVSAVTAMKGGGKGKGTSSSSSKEHGKGGGGQHEETKKVEPKKVKKEKDDSKCAELLLADCPYGNVLDNQCVTSRTIADQAVHALFVDFDVAVARSLLAPDYIEHNPTAPTGAEQLLSFVPALQESGLSMEVHRTIVDGNLVAYHSTFTNADLFGAPTLVGFDVFRVENGLVQEHWDNLQVLQGPNPNGHSMVDGPTMVKYRDQTASNKAIALGLVRDVLQGGNVTALPDYISSVEYTQHNPAIADGLTGLGEGLTALAAQGRTVTYDNIPVQLVVAEGNFVLIGSPGELGAGNPTAYYDLFRIEDGLIVEHWDVIQAIPPAAEFANDNGKF
jgi:predicted SnoaL-like aldol condensation-catalyzing enzyme